MIAALVGLVAKRVQKDVEGGDGVGLGLEPVELRVILIPTSLTGEHGPGQQALTPARYETADVEVLRVQAPKPHGSAFLCRRPHVFVA